MKIAQKNLKLTSFLQQLKWPDANIAMMCNTNTPAWICAQGSHHAFPRSGGEPGSCSIPTLR